MIPLLQNENEQVDARAGFSAGVRRRCLIRKHMSTANGNCFVVAPRRYSTQRQIFIFIAIGYCFDDILAARLHGEARPDASVKNRGERHIPHPDQLPVNVGPLLGNERHYLGEGAADQPGSLVGIKDAGQ